MRRVFTASNAVEAHFVRCLMEAGGLEATVQDEFLAGMSGEVWPTVWILDDRCEAEARQIVTEYESTGPRPPEAGRLP